MKTGEEMFDATLLKRALAVSCLVIGGVAAFAYIVFDGGGSPHEQSHSHHSDGLHVPKFGRAPAHANHLRKTRGHIRSELTSNISSSPIPGQSFKIQAHVELSRDSGELHYKFDLPSGLRLLAGKAEGLIYDARKGDLHEIELTVVSTATEKGTGKGTASSPVIKFAAWELNGGEAVGNGVSLRLSEESLAQLPGQEGLQKSNVSAQDALRSKDRSPAALTPEQQEEFRKRAIH